ncbi:PEX11G [Bugula neritina]|uniref:PEX11G n=1 Tax=Bugula neritina TaxID=10212 RepID=A0A7J7JHM1_BUGNE|nr:PEX11G [Bugula neritina]
MRTTAYCFSLIATRYSNTKLGTRAGRIATALNSTRAFTRLLDDLPMLKATLTYGFGKQGEPILSRVLQVIENVAYQLFFPVEHLALLCQLEVLPVANRQKWVSRCTTLWAVALVCVISKNVMLLAELLNAKEKLLKSEPSLDRGESGLHSSKAKELDSRLRLTKLTIIKDSCDFLNAVNWLPITNFLWSGKLSPSQSAIAGLVSSLVGFQILRLTS